MATGRATGLDVSVFSVGGDILATVRDAELSFEGEGDANNETLPMRWSREVLLSQRTTLRFTRNRGTAPAWATALDVSAFSIGGVDYIGKVERGRISITTQTEDVRAVNELHAYPQALSTNCSIEGDLLYTNADERALALLLDDADPAVRSVTVSVTIDGETLTGPFLLMTLRHRLAHEAVQRIGVVLNQEGSLAAQGGYTSVPTGLLNTALVGSGVVSVQVTTSAALGAGYSISGQCLITSVNVSFEKGRVISDEYTMEFQGAPTIANA